LRRLNEQAVVLYAFYEISIDVLAKIEQDLVRVFGHFRAKQSAPDYKISFFAYLVLEEFLAGVDGLAGYGERDFFGGGNGSKGHAGENGQGNFNGPNVLFAGDLQIDVEGGGALGRFLGEIACLGEHLEKFVFEERCVRVVVTAYVFFESHAVYAQGESCGLVGFDVVHVYGRKEVFGLEGAAGITEGNDGNQA